MRYVTLLSLVALLIFPPPASAAEAPMNAVQLMREAREYQDAIDILNEYLRENPADAAAWRELGITYGDAGKWDDAIYSLQRSVDLQPNDLDSRLALAETLGEKARRSGGFTAIRTAKRWKKELERNYEQWPENIEARRWLVRYLVNAPGIGGGDKDRGLEIARATIALDDFEGRLLTAYALRTCEDYSAAIAQYDTLLRSYPDGAKVVAGYGYTYLAADRLDDALVWMQRWVYLVEWDVEAHTGLGQCYEARGETDQAIESYRRALEIDPFWSNARYPLAGILDEEKRYKEARQEYEFISDKTPEFYLAGKAKKRAYELRKKKY